MQVLLEFLATVPEGPGAVVGELLLDRLLQRDVSLPAHLRDADDGVGQLRRDAERLALVVSGDGVEIGRAHV